MINKQVTFHTSGLWSSVIFRMLGCLPFSCHLGAAISEIVVIIKVRLLAAEQEVAVTTNRGGEQEEKKTKWTSDQHQTYQSFTDALLIDGSSSKMTDSCRKREVKLFYRLHASLGVKRATHRISGFLKVKSWFYCLWITRKCTSHLQSWDKICTFVVLAVEVSY